MKKTVVIKQKLVRYVGLDILKFICAFLVICIHCPFPGEFGKYITALSRISVPIFFMITGFFYQNILDSKREAKQIKKIFILMVVSNFIYIVWNIFYCLLSGGNVGKYISSVFTLKSMLKFLIFNESQFASHLWYLCAILYVLIIVYFARHFHLMNILFYITPFLLIGDLVLGKYSLLLLHKEFPYIIVRNFIFVGIPYFCIGMLLYKYNKKLTNKNVPYFILSLIFSITTILERFFIVKFGLDTRRDHYISTTFLAVLVFLLFKEIYKEKTLNTIEKFAEKLGRECSMEVYILHPIFIKIMAFVTGFIGIKRLYEYIAPLVIYFLCLVVIVTFKKLNKKNKHKNEDIASKV